MSAFPQPIDRSLHSSQAAPLPRWPAAALAQRLARNLFDCIDKGDLLGASNAAEMLHRQRADGDAVRVLLVQMGREWLDGATGATPEPCSEPTDPQAMGAALLVYPDLLTRTPGEQAAAVDDAQRWFVAWRAELAHAGADGADARSLPERVEAHRRAIARDANQAILAIRGLSTRLGVSLSEALVLGASAASKPATIEAGSRAE